MEEFFDMVAVIEKEGSKRGGTGTIHNDGVHPPAFTAHMTLSGREYMVALIPTEQAAQLQGHD